MNKSWLVAVAMASLFTGPARAQPAPDPAALRAEAFAAAQWAQQTSAGNALAQVGARFAASGGGLGDSVRQRQDIFERWQMLDRQLTDALATPGEAGLARARRMRVDLDASGDALTKMDERLARDFPEYTELSSPKPLAERDAQALLGEEEALIVVFPGERNSFVWALTKQTANWTRVDRSAAQIEAMVAKLRAALDPDGVSRAAQSSFEEETTAAAAARRRERAAFPRAEAHQIYRLFLQPLEPVWKSRKRLNIVVSGPLSSLPFSVLVTAPPVGDDADPEALRKTQWLVRGHALATLPTVSSLRALRRFSARQAGTAPFQGFGAPKLGGSGEARNRARARSAGQYFRGVYADVEAVRQLSSLPETEGELRQLAQALGSGPASIVVGENATETAVKRADLSQTRVLAFATHGLVAGELKGLAEPALVFTPPREATDLDDGLLTATEAAQLKLAADWVILSACNTASSDGKPGAEGLSGLARAFFYAGAKALLVSHWPVLDIAAARLTTRTFAEMRRDPAAGRAEALRRSMLGMIDDASDPLFAQPMAWAPFVVVGEGG